MNKNSTVFNSLICKDVTLDQVEDNLWVYPMASLDSQDQTANAFSDKWSTYDYLSEDFKKSCSRQRGWYLDLYGFESESLLKKFLMECPVILDAGSGTGHKAAWFAKLSPNSIVIGADISESVYEAAKFYKDIPNLVFVQCDIAKLDFLKSGVVDYVSCDQVIHHTSYPRATFSELVRVTKMDGEISTYVYRRKALPRELLDDHFREYSKSMTHEQRMNLSRQLMSLGRQLAQFTEELNFPNIPDLDIEGGKMTVQRFIYWNFIKCFWNEELGEHISTMTNYDWYAPSQAFRYSESEFQEWINEEQLKIIHFHQENACYSGRFKRVRVE